MKRRKSPLLIILLICGVVYYFGKDQIKNLINGNSNPSIDQEEKEEPIKEIHIPQNGIDPNEPIPGSPGNHIGGSITTDIKGKPFVSTSILVPESHQPSQLLEKPMYQHVR